MNMPETNADIKTHIDKNRRATELAESFPDQGETMATVDANLLERAEKAEELVSLLRDAVTEYHLELDMRQDGTLAGYSLQDKVQHILNMHWRQGFALKEKSNTTI